MWPALVLATALAGGGGNAWKVWSDDADLEPLDHVDLPGEDLREDSRIPAEQLTAAAAQLATLDRAVARISAGLALPTCQREGGQAPLRLAKAAVARALVAARKGEDPAPIVQDLLTLGRRVGRCENGGLFLFLVGQWIGEQGTRLARWGAHWGVWSPEQTSELRKAIAREPLTQADLSRALDFERAAVLEHLPPASRDGADYSRADTERLVRWLFAKLKAARNAADFSAVRKQREELLAPSEVPLVNAKDGPPRLDPAALGHGARPNLVGRFLVRDLLPRIDDVTRQAVDRLHGEQQPRLATRNGVARLAWVDRGPAEDTVDVSASSAAPAVDLGTCARLAPDRYRIDRATEDKLIRTDALMRVARVVPHFQDGGADGFALFGIGEGSFAASCGFRNRDVLLSINGRDLRDPSAALAAMDAVRLAGYAAFVLQRDGRRVQFTVEGSP